MGARTGVELRDKSIRVGFSLDGVWTRETLKIAPTAANKKYAERLVRDVNAAIKAGTFEYHEHFPDSPRAKKPDSVKTFGKMCDMWLETKGRLASKTLSQYRNAIGVWKGLFGAETPIAQLTHGKVAAKIGTQPWASAKLLNNYLICLRGVFSLAGREMKLENPMEGIENSKSQAVAPDPLSLDEMRRVLKALEEMDMHEYVINYFIFAFLTGMRPEELIALRWSDIDYEHETILVQRARSDGQYKPLKTYQSREVDLVEGALEVLSVMRSAQAKNDGYIFQNPVTGKPWNDERSQRDHYWKPALYKAGIRYRRAYQTRHTYATNALSAGVNPTYISRQMGHKSAKMLFQVYAKWIDGADRGRERDKLEKLFKQKDSA